MKYLIYSFTQVYLLETNCNSPCKKWIVYDTFSGTKGHFFWRLLLLVSFREVVHSSKTKKMVDTTNLLSQRTMKQNFNLHFSTKYESNPQKFIKVSHWPSQQKIMVCLQKKTWLLGLTWLQVQFFFGRF